MAKHVGAALQSVTFALSLSLISAVSHAQAQAPANPMAEMNTKLAKLAGSMSTLALNCGDYSEEQLAEIKAQHKQGLTQSGMSAEQFEQAFTGGKQEAEERWSIIPEAEQSEACEQLESAGAKGS